MYCLAQCGISMLNGVPSAWKLVFFLTRRGRLSNDFRYQRWNRNSLGDFSYLNKPLLRTNSTISVLKNIMENVTGCHDRGQKPCHFALTFLNFYYRDYPSRILSIFVTPNWFNPGTPPIQRHMQHIIQPAYTSSLRLHAVKTGKQ
jgi:hypothetical protein